MESVFENNLDFSITTGSDNIGLKGWHGDYTPNLEKSLIEKYFTVK